MRAVQKRNEYHGFIFKMNSIPYERICIHRCDDCRGAYGVRGCRTGLRLDCSAIINSLL